VFDVDLYLSNINPLIKKILMRPQKDRITYDLLNTKTVMHYKLLILKHKQLQMKIGEIWQEIIGQYDTFINLGTGHCTGLDVLSERRKIVIEIKNRTNTDNASAKKSNLDKLSNFKKHNMAYTCVYACINADTEEKTVRGDNKLLYHEGVPLQHMVGKEFLKFIFGVNMDKIINFVKKIIDEYCYTNQVL